MPSVDSNVSVEYRTIDRHVGYRFGSDGSVWSSWELVYKGVSKGCRSASTGPWKRMKPQIGSSGYFYILLKTPGSRGFSTYLLHRLILEAFVGPPPEGRECCHRDGVKTNVSPDNLYWGTREENLADCERHGRRKKKLKPDEVIAIRAAVACGESEMTVARRYGVTAPSIHAIKHRRTWKYI